MKKQMRIVAMSGRNIWIQTKTGYEWEQNIITNEAFEEMMKKDYPEHWAAFEKREKNLEDWEVQYDREDRMQRFFWTYGCTEKMLRKGESFVFGK